MDLMIDTPIDRIDKDFIDQLIQDKEPEGTTLEYKRDLPRPQDRKHNEEFAKDISSFANTTGGYIFYGIEGERDQDNKATGTPASVAGISGETGDQAILRLDQILQSWVDPRIMPMPQFKEVNGFAAGGSVLAVRIPKSLNGPHMVVKGDNRFWYRAGAGKSHLDVHQIRSAFLASDEIPRRIQRFREERIASIVTKQTPIPLNGDPKFVIHVIPLTAFAATQPDPLPDHSRLGYGMLPDSFPGASSRFNFDGILFYSSYRENGGHCGYTQIFRNGSIEGTFSDFTGPWGEMDPVTGILSLVLVSELYDLIGKYLKFLRQTNTPSPVVVLVSLVGVKECILVTSAEVYRMRKNHIDRDILLLPEVILEDLSQTPDKVLRPILDVLWQAAGYSRCTLYDGQGVLNLR